MAVGRQPHVREGRQPRLEVGEQRADLVGRGVADRVGHVERRRARLRRRPQRVDQELRLGADGVLGRELDVVELGPGVGDRLRMASSTWARRHLQLGLPVDRAGGQEDVQPPLAGAGASALPAASMSRLGRARQAADHRPLDRFGHGADRLGVAGRGGGEAGLDDVDAEVAQRLGDLHLVGRVHAEAGRLLAVAQGGVEDQDAVVVRLVRCPFTGRMRRLPDGMAPRRPPPCGGRRTGGRSGGPGRRRSGRRRGRGRPRPGCGWRRRASPTVMWSISKPRRSMRPMSRCSEPSARSSWR